ncbi:HNH endonuclease [Streptococcus catagoni]|uniref:HNH endonuclease n=1 Tax=Streptococcus catagoni TaxID=2654874 RepID=UPI001407812A|nr:HNH endonuclease signature motif containing protein [Streptococcus catagoni]
MKKRTNKTSAQDIVDYWSLRIDESNLSVDWSEASERCWRCAHKTKLQRCHIIPHASGGEDSPSNLVLLCKRCHLENPNVTDPEIMWDWLKAYKVTFYDTFWIVQGLEEYEKIYGYSFLEKAKELGLTNLDDFKAVLASKMKGSIRHFGEPHLNKATVAGTLQMIYKELNKE